MAQKQRTVVIVKNESGEVVNVCEVKVFLEEHIKELEKQANENRVRALAKAQEEKRELEHSLEKACITIGKLELRVAKLMFDDLVEKGVCSTSDEFELAFERYLQGHDLDLSKAPVEFKEIVRGLDD